MFYDRRRHASKKTLLWKPLARVSKYYAYYVYDFYPNSTSRHGRNRHLRFARTIHIQSHHCLTCNNDNDDDNNEMHNNKPAAAAACDVVVVRRNHVIYTTRHPPCVRHNIINLRRFSSLDLLLSLMNTSATSQRRRRRFSSLACSSRVQFWLTSTAWDSTDTHSTLTHG